MPSLRDEAWRYTDISDVRIEDFLPYAESPIAASEGDLPGPVRKLIEEGEENAPTHIRAAFMGPSVLVPLGDDGTPALGTWQGIFFCEFDGPRERSVHVAVLA